MAYIIQKGDTLSAIAKNNNTTVSALLAANPQISDANRIRAGQTLELGGSVAGAASPLPAGEQKVRNGVYGYGEEVSDHPNAKGTYGYVSTGNAVSPWATLAERKQDIESWVAKGGFGGYDGMGGVFNKSGYSNNPYFLQGTAGVTREQLKGTAAEQASDAMIAMAVNADPFYSQSRGFYVYSDGTFGNAVRPDGISSREILQAIADARGLTLQHGAYLDPVGFYDGSGWEAAPAVTAQQLMEPDYELETEPAGNGSVNSALQQKQTAEPEPEKKTESEDWWEQEKIRRLTRILAGYSE